VLEAVVASPDPATVAELATRLGSSSATVRKHLDELVREGAVEVTSDTSGRPGRPRLRYRPAAPPAADAYERLSSLLVRALADGVSPEEVGRLAGHERCGTPEERPEETLLRAMGDDGFDPVLEHDPSGPVIVFRRCPYARAALEDRSVVCGLHRGFAAGVLEGEGGGRVALGALEVHDPRIAGCRLHLTS
jgi:predicted ArsR family transcriptional regulator